jgi:hypothetical protein
MPSLPDIPGLGLVSGTTKRAKVLAGSAVVGAVGVGGLVLRRVLGHGGDGDGASADPIAETPTAPPGAEDKPVPKAKPAKPAKPKAAKPKTAKADAAASKPKAGAKPKPPAPAKPKPKAEPSKEPIKPRDPHHELNNPVVDDPDLTEFPDPYDKREDPRDPVDSDGMSFGEEPHPQTGSESTSEPPLEQDPTVERGGRPPQRDKLDD